MPHIKLEYSSNVLEKNAMDDLFADIHHMLTKELPTKMLSCKSRGVECQTYFLGDGKRPNAFVHAEVKLVKGRSRETLDKVASLLLSLLKAKFAGTAELLELELSLEIIELQATYYSPWAIK